MTVMGVNTSKVVVASGATDALRRHPAIIAQSVATVDNIIGGRSAVGIGAGEAMNLLPFGIAMTDLYGRLREAIQIIKLLWLADHTRPANFKGKFYQLKNAFLQIKPVTKPYPPIYVGSFGQKMLEMTGELADGWLPFSHTPDTYSKCLKGAIRKGAEKVGRLLSEIEPALLQATTISKSYDEARETIEKVAKRFLVLLPSILTLLAPQIEHPGLRYTLTHWMGYLRKENREVISKVAEQIPTDLALKTVIYGTPDDCIEQIERFAEAGCRHIIFGLRGKDWNRQIQLFGSKVIPYFKEAQSTS